MRTCRIKLLMESKLRLYCEMFFMDFDDNFLQDILNITGRLACVTCDKNIISYFILNIVKAYCCFNFRAEDF